MAYLGRRRTSYFYRMDNVDNGQKTRWALGSETRSAFGLVWTLGLIASAALLCTDARGQIAPAQGMEQKPSAAIPVDAANPSLPVTPATGSTAERAAPAYSRVDVHYADGKLIVDATNASLNQILREISHKTGIKLTGGVTDERVYGHYGPAAPSEVLASLLDGTESNMLLVANTHGPSELILTPRLGGPTPPNPNAGADQSAVEPRQDPQGFGIRRPIGLHRGMENAPAADQSSPPPSNPEAIQNPAPTTDQTTDQSPNGTKTPQQIYEQLRQLQQQQAQQAQQSPQ